MSDSQYETDKSTTNLEMALKLDNPDVNGKTRVIRYIASDNTGRAAQLTDTDYHSAPTPFGKQVWATDCEWQVWNPDGQLVQVPFIKIRATDGSVRHVRIACEAKKDDEVVFSDFVWVNPDGSDEIRNKYIQFNHPNGRIFQCEILDAIPRFPNRPVFQIKFIT